MNSYSKVPNMALKIQEQLPNENKGIDRTLPKSITSAHN